MRWSERRSDTLADDLRGSCSLDVSLKGSNSDRPERTYSGAEELLHLQTLMNHDVTHEESGGEVEEAEGDEGAGGEGNDVEQHN